MTTHKRDLGPEAPEFTSEKARDSASPSTWDPMDLGDIVAGLQDGSIEGLKPTVLPRSDGEYLFYSGCVNCVAGPPGVGKSMIILWACVCELLLGSTVVYIDYEDTPLSVVSRLLAMGCAGDVLAQRFVYIRPSEKYSVEAKARLEGLVRERRPTLVVIDSTGESLALDGFRPNEDDQIVHWLNNLPDPLADLGPAVVLIDHMAKNDRDARGPIGSQRKLSGLSGAQYIARSKRAFSKQQAGTVELVCTKDRPGGLHPGEVEAVVTVTPSDGTIVLTVDAPTATKTGTPDFRPTALMERVSRYVERTSPPPTQNKVVATLKGQKQALKTALQTLVAEGYIDVTEDGQSYLHTHVKPYRQPKGLTTGPPH